MAGPLITDELWHELVPHLDGRAKGLRRGRPLTSDRATITGILFVLKTGIAWKDLPRELNCGSGMTCLRRLRGWQRIGVWERMCEVLRRPGFGLERLDWARVEVRRSRRIRFPSGNEEAIRPTDVSRRPEGCPTGDD